MFKEGKNCDMGKEALGFTVGAYTIEQGFVISSLDACAVVANGTCALIVRASASRSRGLWLTSV